MLDVKYSDGRSPDFQARALPSILAKVGLWVRWEIHVPKIIREEVVVIPCKWETYLASVSHCRCEAFMGY